jgi:hypothetical protein
MDMLRPDGPLGRLVLRGRGRDIVTRDDGGVEVVAEASADVVVDFVQGRAVVSLATEPSIAEAGALVGVRAGPGFRAVLERAAPGQAGSLSYLLLDEVPVVTLISRAALSDDGVDEPGGAKALPKIDICAGWVDGGRLARSLQQKGRLPEIRRPHAPDLSMADDPWAWHEQPDLPPGGMRRIRRIDVAPSDDGRDVWQVNSMFRDSLMDPVHGQTVVHEYSLAAVVEGPTGRINDIAVIPRVLPGPECPAAAASAQRVVGRLVGELRAFVSAEFPGVTTCTHLNDQLRALGDVGSLLAVAT